MTLSSDKTALGDRMKWYEREWRHEFPRGAWCVLRVDVRAAHTYLAGAAKPFDPWFSQAMIAVAENLCAEIQGAVLAYTQSDECSVIYRAPSEKSEPWFGGVLAKQVSISAALATAVLAEEHDTPKRAIFDSRAFMLPWAEEVDNYLIWRQRDAMRNSVSMVAQSVFSHRQLHGKNTGQMITMLANEGVIYQNFAEGDRLGRQTVKETGIREVTYTDRRTQEQISTNALRSWWDTTPAPLYQVGATPITNQAATVAAEQETP